MATRIEAVVNRAKVDGVLSSDTGGRHIFFRLLLCL